MERQQCLVCTLRDLWRLASLLQDSSISPYFVCFDYLIPSYKTTSLPFLVLQTLPLEPLISFFNPQLHCHICEGIACVPLTIAVTKGSRTLPMPKEAAEAVPGSLGSWRPAGGQESSSLGKLCICLGIPCLRENQSRLQKGRAWV